MRTFRSFDRVMPALAVAWLAAATSSACGRPPASEPEAAATVDPVAQTVAWRAKHEADYRREWATIAGLHFLHPGAQTAGSASSNELVLPSSTPPVIGRFVLDGEEVRFEPSTESVKLRDKPVSSSIVLQDDGSSNADELKIGSVTIAVHRSGERKSLRVWDPDGQQARGFAGFKWFDIQPDYRVTGRFIPDSMPRTMKVVNTFGDFDEYKTEGVVEFTLNGRMLRLRPFTTRPKRFYFVFKDASSGVETYDAARFVYADLRDDGTTVLDFNQAYNPPCSFNPFTTCPIPLPENRLPIKVLAGERQYQGHVAEAGL